MITESIEEEYTGYKIIAFKDTDEKSVTYRRTTYRNGVHFLSDCRTVDGVPYTGLRQAINDGKKEIDILRRLKEIE